MPTPSLRPISPSTSGGSVNGMRKIPLTIRMSASAPSRPSSSAIAGTEISGGDAAQSTSPCASGCGRPSARAAKAVTTGVATSVQASTSASSSGRRAWAASAGQSMPRNAAAVSRKISTLSAGRTSVASGGKTRPMNSPMARNQVPWRPSSASSRSIISPA